jgi:mannan endo-1,4-beta-mannosidase
MNATWFWWGENDIRNPTNADNFKLLWQDMHNTLTNDFGLHNLVWVYAPNATGTSTGDLTTMYPGANYVDLVGVDIYSDVPKFYDFATLKQFNKTIVLAETGPGGKSYGKFNELDLVDMLRGKAAYFLQWNGWKGAQIGIKENVKFQDMMRKPYALTLDTTR